MQRVYCGVPIAVCSGSYVTLNAAWNPDGMANKKSGKLHTDHQSAFRCYCRYLISQGYVRVGQKEFQKDDGPVLILDRQSKFGAVFRLGKASEKTKSRFTPKNGRGATAERLGGK